MMTKASKHLSLWIGNQNFTTRFHSLSLISQPIEPNFYCLSNENTLFNIIGGI